jgi:hypothetical protein
MRTLIIFMIVLLSSCSTYKVSTMGHGPEYSLNLPDNITIDTLNYRQLQWKLRTDFNFRYDFAVYAMNQPFNYRFGRYNRFGMFNPQYSSTQYWMNWAFGNTNFNMWDNWGYPYGNNYVWNGWSNGYGYNAWHQFGGIYGRRMSIQDRRGIAAMGNSRISRETTAVIHGNNNTRVRVKRTNVKPKVVIRNKPIKVYKPIPFRNNSIPINNTRSNRVVRNNNNNSIVIKTVSRNPTKNQ